MELTLCTACAAFGNYVEVEDEPLPETTTHLAVPSPELAKAYEFTSENLLVCASCGTYYAWRRWNPGGSCDAMHTCTHKSVRRMRMAEVPLELGARISELMASQEEYRGTALEEHYRVALRGVHTELVRLQARAGEILTDAIDWLHHRHAGSEAFLAEHDGVVPDWYPSGHLDEMRERERGNARRCARLLEVYAPLAGDGPWRQSLVTLAAEEEDEHIRALAVAAAQKDP